MRRTVDFVHNARIGTASVMMTGDEVLAMHECPIEVIPAPSGEQMIVILACTSQWIAGQARFETEAPGLYYGSPDGAALAVTLSLAALDGGPAVNEVVTDVVDSNGIPTDTAQNAPILMTDSAQVLLTDPDNTQADGTLYIHVQYSIIALNQP